MSEWFAILAAAQTLLVLIAIIALGEMLSYLGLSPAWQTRVRGLFLILIAALSLVLHFPVNEPNLYIDQRGAAIAIATLFGGVRIGALAMLAELLVRGALGGYAMWAGWLGIVLDYLLSVAVLHWMLRDKVGRVNLRALLLAGALVGLSEAVSLTYIPPLSLGIRLFEQLGFELLLVQWVTTLAIGWLLYLQIELRLQYTAMQAKNQELKSNLYQLINALSSAMALRDRTTAGHEKQVAQWAVQIGQQLNMTQDQLEGLHLVAMVHDVGQIQTPAEILTRSRRLRPEEFELIKLHCEAGFEVLKEVHFPWPLAEIVYQHHENMDGSGYPRGLKGNDIALEARILRVCDSIDAMLSHRPFRRAYTPEEVIAELRAGRGKFFDPTVVDASIPLLMNQPDANNKVESQ